MHTSCPTLSAYERGHKSPTLETAARLLAEAGFGLTISPRVEFAEHITARGRPIVVPTMLPRLSLEQAFATVTLPLHLNWSAPGRQSHLLDRSQRGGRMMADPPDDRPDTVPEGLTSFQVQDFPNGWGALLPTRRHQLRLHGPLARSRWIEGRPAPCGFRWTRTTFVSAQQVCW